MLDLLYLFYLLIDYLCNSFVLQGYLLERIKFEYF